MVSNKEILLNHLTDYFLVHRHNILYIGTEENCFAELKNLISNAVGDHKYRYQNAKIFSVQETELSMLEILDRCLDLTGIPGVCSTDISKSEFKRIIANKPWLIQGRPDYEDLSEPIGPFLTLIFTPKRARTWL